MPLLKEGASGEVVRALQRVLTNGAPGAWNTTPQGIDGSFGPHKKASVKAFQGWAGVPSDGLWAIRLGQSLCMPRVLPWKRRSGSAKGTGAGAPRQRRPFVVCSRDISCSRDDPRSGRPCRDVEREARMEYHDGHLSRAQLGARLRASPVARGGSGCVQEHPFALVTSLSTNASAPT
jgi:peptidoglycan hydrolase-like protein with peptidoglycan-binding domain